MKNISVSAKAIIVNEGKVLVLEYCDEVGLHYNFPGGKLYSGKTIKEGLLEKVYLETCLKVEIERLLFVVEYEPKHWHHEFGSTQKLQFQFLCKVPDFTSLSNILVKDDNLTGYLWVDINELHKINLLPRIQKKVQKSLLNNNYDSLLDEW